VPVVAAATRKVIGIDLGGTKMLSGAIDEDLGVNQPSYDVVEGLSQEQILDRIADTVSELRDEMPEIEAVGFGLPCLIDQRSGVAMMAVNLPIVDLPFRDMMTERLGVPVFMDNDANVAVLVEQRSGAAQGHQDVIGLTIGTGIGGGIVIGGRIYRGWMGAGGELGHMVVDEDGPQCQGNCPNRGCLEAVASGVAIGNEGRVAAAGEPDSSLHQAMADGLEITGQLVTDLAHEGDELARMVLGHCGRKLGVGLSNIVNIFNPEVIVLGGGAMAAGDMILRPARDEMLRRALPAIRDKVEIVKAKFGPEAGMLGAALFAFDELGEPAVQAQ
jgi:glucokinase